MIDRDLKRSLGQMMKGVQVVTATHDGVVRGYCSHWVCQVAFEEPILMASVSPRHDTHPLIVASGSFTVSVLAGDQVDVGQYFSYPGRRFHHIAEEWLTEATPGRWIVPDAVAWLGADVFERKSMADHELFFARITEFGAGRLREPPLLYSSRLGWRVTGDKARTEGRSVRDELLERVRAAGLDDGGSDDDDGDGDEG